MDEIDWDDYYKYTNDWGDSILEHMVKGCHAEMLLTWGSMRDAIDTAMTHHEICPIKKEN
jgi:hypothetical protein